MQIEIESKKLILPGDLITTDQEYMRYPKKRKRHIPRKRLHLQRPNGLRPKIRKSNKRTPPKIALPRRRRRRNNRQSDRNNK